MGNLYLLLGFAVKSKTALNCSLFLKSRQVHKVLVTAWAATSLPLDLCSSHNPSSDIKGGLPWLDDLRASLFQVLIQACCQVWFDIESRSMPGVESQREGMVQLGDQGRPEGCQDMPVGSARGWTDAPIWGEGRRR